MVATEYEHCIHFEDILRDDLRVLIALQREQDFTVLVEKVKIANDVKRAKHQHREKDRGRNKRVWEPQPCVDCGRRHQGECWKCIGACLRCESLEHLIRDCSWRSDQMQVIGMGKGAGHTEVRQPTLVYTARRREDRDAPDVISSTFFIHNHYSGVIVLSPLGQSVRVNKLFKDVPMEVQRVIFLIDLMELPFGEFDLILGIDWLVKHQVNLDCAAKWVVLKTKKGDEVVLIGERRSYLSNVISALRAEKLVCKGCEAYLAYISALDSEVPSVKDIRTVKDFLNVFLDELPGLPPNCEVPSVKDIRTVKDFLNVFLDELPGLPPNCEVDFGIDLLLGIALVSIAPYRTAPKELDELKALI
ncbi:uncharacterized protein LOC128290581 [Gossypium arboreum]|uniref:uncharacterized protein LOC128290581 n=1 Tax=Gossypium arboreum TaxID=29729 RepID=UPI0022F173F0|nr:uncharacterized protein LOC128290581 [Gossypium arboreum]